MSQLRGEFKALRMAVHAHCVEILRECNEDHYAYGWKTFHLRNPGLIFPLFVDDEKDRTDEEALDALNAFNQGASDYNQFGTV